MANARGPYWVLINYESAYGLHSHSINTNAWTNAASPGGKGQFASHNGPGVDANDMIVGLVDKLREFFPATTTYLNWTIFHQPADPGPSFPQAEGIITTGGGLSTAGGWDKASQAIFWFKTAAFGNAKLVLLDQDTADNWDKITSGYSADIIALAAEFEDADNAWCGRDNSRPNSLISVTIDLNDALRKQYRMA